MFVWIEWGEGGGLIVGMTLNFSLLKGETTLKQIYRAVSKKGCRLFSMQNIVLTSKGIRDKFVLEPTLETMAQKHGIRLPWISCFNMETILRSFYSYRRWKLKSRHFVCILVGAPERQFVTKWGNLCVAFECYLMTLLALGLVIKCLLVIIF